MVNNIIGWWKWKEMKNSLKNLLQIYVVITWTILQVIEIILQIIVQNQDQIWIVNNDPFKKRKFSLFIVI